MKVYRILEKFRKECSLKVKLEEFNYELPKELIAQHPIEKRDESRLMVLDRTTQSIEHRTFKDIIEYLNPGDCLVINDTKVIPARIYGVKKYNEVNLEPCQVEILLLKNLGEDKWESLVKPGRRLPVGAKMSFGEGILEGEILEVLPDGNRIVKFYYKGIFNEILDKIGVMPLPPYIKERLSEKDRYQTVYAKYEGSSAAPTAGLHFTEEILNKIREKGIKIAKVTLHVGIGTFRPVKVENIEEHQMHTEHYILTKENADIINNAKKEGKKIIAVGTTSSRVLESVADIETGLVKEGEGDTSIFIYPGYKFKIVDNLITNFHLPESSLIMLVSALAGKEFIMKAYNEAIKEKYRFFSFGDAMFIK